MTSVSDNGSAASGASRDQLTIENTVHTVLERRMLKASAKAGIGDGVYPVVLIEGKDGKKTYKAAVGGQLYTIKNYGKGDDEVIIKLREKHAERPSLPRAASRAAAPSVHDDDAEPELSIDDDVLELLKTLRRLDPKIDLDELLNRQLRSALQAKVAELELAHRTIAQLPADVLRQLLEAGPAAADKLRAALASDRG